MPAVLEITGSQGKELKKYQIGLETGFVLGSIKL